MPLAGYPESERNSSGIKDPILCSAIHLRSGGAGLVILSLDLLSLDPASLRRIRKEVFDATATPAHSLFIGTTQTHSAPHTSRCLRWYGKPGYSPEENEYMDLLIKQAAAAASEATVTSRPASLAFLNLNEPNTGAILIREDPAGKIIAVLIVYNDIPEHLGPNNRELSSDFVHATRKQLAARFGGSPVVCFFPSPQGTGKLLNYGKVSDKNNADEAGKALANLIVSKTKELKKSDFTSDIKMSSELITVPAKPKRNIPTVQQAEQTLLQVQKERKALSLDSLSDDELLNNNWLLASASSTLGFSMASEQGLLSHLYEDYRTFEVQKITIGDTCILGMPCTMTNACASQISTLAAGQRLLIAECINGDMEGAIMDTEGDACGLLSPIFTIENGQPLLDAAAKILS